MTRALILLLAGLMVFCAGCGSVPEPDADTSAQTATTAPTPDPVEGLMSATGQVIAIEGMVYTLAIGEMTSAGPDASAEGTVPAGQDAPQAAAASPSPGLYFRASGRQLEVNMRDAVVRSRAGNLEPDVPVSDVVVGDVVTAYLTASDSCAYVTVIAGAAVIQDGQGQAEQGTAAAEIRTDEYLDGQSYEAAGTDENAMRAVQARVSLSGCTVSKSGGECTNPESAACFGMNAALLATDMADLIVAGSQITSVPACAAGIFSYGSGTSVSISDSTVSTQGAQSSGLAAAGGASTDAQDIVVTTSGSGAPALRADGGTNLTVSGGSFATEGLDSPVVHAAADVAVRHAELRASGSEAFVLENEGTLTLQDCSVSGAMSRSEGSASGESVHNILICAAGGRGESSFDMHGGSLTSQNGDMFFITNTRCSVELNAVQITNHDQLAWLFNIAGNSGALGWGSAGANGAHADIILRGQNTIGDTRVDSISSMTMHLMEGTNLRGGIRLETNEAADPAARGTADVIIDEGCVWSLTGNSEVTTLENRGTIEFNGHTVTLADGTVLSA